MKKDSGKKLIMSDRKAKDILLMEAPKNDVSKKLLQLAIKTSNLYSFVDYQTYPRPSHPLLEKRLDPMFTFVAIITSLRCTLETERRVVNCILRETNNDLDLLNGMDVDTFTQLLRPAGMAKQKSRWIVEGLKMFSSKKEYNADYLKNIPSEDARNRLLLLHGMGPKATDCFMLLGLDIPVFPVDINVFKVVSTLFPDMVVNRSNSVPSFSKSRHVLAVKGLLEETFRRDAKLYQVLHTYLLLAGRYKVLI